MQPHSQGYAVAIAMGQEPPMPGHSEDAVDDRAQQSPQDSQKYLFFAWSGKA
jgi:hypothetical protein